MLRYKVRARGSGKWNTTNYHSSRNSLQSTFLWHILDKGHNMYIVRWRTKETLSEIDACILHKGNYNWNWCMHFLLLSGAFVLSAETSASYASKLSNFLRQQRSQSGYHCYQCLCKHYAFLPRLLVLSTKLWSWCMPLFFRRLHRSFSSNFICITSSHDFILAASAAARILVLCLSCCYSAEGEHSVGEATLHNTNCRVGRRTEALQVHFLFCTQILSMLI
jgi:hypothetical protein